MTNTKLQDNKTTFSINSESVSNLAKINVENVPCYCSIGIHEEEKKMGQRLSVSVYLEANLSNAFASDSVKDTVSYVDVYNIVQEVGNSKSHSLIEVLANQIAENLLKLPLVLKTKVKVKKPHIPFPEFQGEVSVEIERSK